MRNWAGNVEYRARRVLEPRSVAELQEVVATSERLRPIGTRFSFSRIADTTGDLLSLQRMPRRLEIDPAARTATIDGGATYGAICPRLHAAGLALQNLPSLPHVTVAGACATGTHGSGDRFGVLAGAVSAIELVTADGGRRLAQHRQPEAAPDATEPDARADDIPLEAAAVSLGALGIVTALTLELEPAYDVRQDVYEHVPAAAFEDAFQAGTQLADSASFFTTWRDDDLDQVWLKRRLPVWEGTGLRNAGDLPPDFFGGPLARHALHPIRSMSADACTPQLGVAGPWHERLPHFRLSHTPSSGEELQSEYFVSRSEAGPAFRALDAIADRLAPVVQVSEIRTIAGDELWLSPAYGRASVAFHFTWVPDSSRVLPVLPVVERALERFEPRAHWGKLSTLAPEVIAGRAPRLGDFVRLASKWDPTGKLRNETLEGLFKVV